MFSVGRGMGLLALAMALGACGGAAAPSGGASSGAASGSATSAAKPIAPAASSTAASASTASPAAGAGASGNASTASGSAGTSGATAAASGSGAAAGQPAAPLPGDGSAAAAKPAGGASPSAPEKVLFADDFKNAAAGKLTKSISGSASSRLAMGYVEGEYMIKLLVPDEVIQFETVPGDFPNAAISVDARVVGTADNNRGIALKCRRQSSVSDYTLIVRPGAGAFGLFRKDRQTIVPLVGPQPAAAIKQGTSVNRVQLACAGSSISASVNGTEVASAQDATYATGQMTFGAEAADVPPWPLPPGTTSDACFTKPQPTCAPVTVEARFANLAVTERAAAR